MLRPPPTSTLFPYTTLFRSSGRPPDRGVSAHECSHVAAASSAAGITHASLVGRDSRPRSPCSRRPTPRSSTLLSDMTGVDPRESAVTSEVELLDPGHQLRAVYEARSSTVGGVGTLPPPGRKRRSRPGWLAVLGS